MNIAYEYEYARGDVSTRRTCLAWSQHASPVGGLHVVDASLLLVRQDAQDAHVNDLLSGLHIVRAVCQDKDKQ